MESQGTDQTAPTPSSEGIVVAPLATAAALDGSVFSRLNTTEDIPASWEERARKAWEYYIEEPLVKNCVNSWRTFAVGDEGAMWPQHAILATSCGAVPMVCLHGRLQRLASPGPRWYKATGSTA